MNGYQRIMAMLAGQEVDHLPYMPITMMFAADQIDVPYGKYATDYQLLVEGQIVTAERFGFDYVSCISDPSREAADCGAVIQYFDDQPPAIDENNALLADKSVLAGLKIPEPTTDGSRMLDRVRAAERFRECVGGRLLVEGWVEGPMAESADLRGINSMMLDFYDDPDFVHQLFSFTLELGIRFAKAQVDAGVDLIGVGDAAASLVGPQIYHDFVMPYEKKLVEAIQAMGAKVRLHICGNTSRMLADMGALGADFIDLDSAAPMLLAREQMPDATVLAGNLDPVKVLRNGTPETITQAVAACHEAAAPRFIVGAGCEVPRDTPHVNLNAMRDYARGHGARL